MKRLACVFVFLIISFPALAWEPPTHAIDEFLKFELNGGRLTGENWRTYTTRYIAAPEGYEEPGWDEVTIASSWQAQPPRCTSDTQCKVPVIFTLFPTAKLNDPKVIPHKSGGKETITYTIVKKGKEWLVVPDFGSPRVLESTYRKYRRK